MRGVIKLGIVAAVLMVLWSPVPARAEGYVNPWAGVLFGNDQAEGDWTWGANGGYMGAGIIGGEASFGFAPKFYGDAVDNYVMDFMGNVIVGIPVGGTSGPGIRPFVTAGLGLIRTNIDSNLPGVDRFTSNDFGFNLGAGVMGYFSDHFGLRADVRYLRTLSDDDFDGDDDLLGFDLGGFDFWRATIGIVIR